MRSAFESTSGSYRFWMRASSIGVTPRNGLSVSAVPPPTKPARSVPPFLGVVAPAQTPERRAWGRSPTAAAAAVFSRSRAATFGRLPTARRRSGCPDARTSPAPPELEANDLPIELRAHSLTRSHRKECPHLRPGSCPRVERSYYLTRDDADMSERMRHVVIPRSVAARAKGRCRGRYAARLGVGFSGGPGGHAGRRDRPLRRQHRRVAALGRRRDEHASRTPAARPGAPSSAATARST